MPDSSQYGNAQLPEIQLPETRLLESRGGASSLISVRTSFLPDTNLLGPWLSQLLLHAVDYSLHLLNNRGPSFVHVDGRGSHKIQGDAGILKFTGQALARPREAGARLGKFGLRPGPAF